MKEQAKHEEPLGKDTIESEEAAKNKRKNYNMLIIILILLLVFLVPMFATYLVFNCDAFAFWVEESSTGDFLGYFASFFALAATIVIAVRQTEISEEMYKIEKNLLNIEENRARIESLGRGVEFTAIGIISYMNHKQGKSKDTKDNNDNNEKHNPCYCKFGLVLKPSDVESVKSFDVDYITCTSKQSSKNDLHVVDLARKDSEDNMGLKCEKSAKENTYTVFVNYNSTGFHIDTKMDYTIILCKYSYTNNFGERFSGEILCKKIWSSDKKSTPDEITTIYCRNEAKKEN